jgi:hypothetical protein
MSDIKEINGKWTVVFDIQELRRCVEFGEFTENGIIYHGELSGPNGMDYMLFPAPWHTEEDIEAAKEELYFQHDVTGISIEKYEGEYPLSQIPPVWTPERKEAAFRKIVAEKSMGSVENCPCVDMQSANAVCVVLDGLQNPENREKFLNYPASLMISLAWSLVK